VPSIGDRTVNIHLWPEFYLFSLHELTMRKYRPPTRAKDIFGRRNDEIKIPTLATTTKNRSGSNQIDQKRGKRSVV
jgi:hypothetical protein